MPIKPPFKASCRFGVLLMLAALPLPASAAWVTERTLASPDGSLVFLLERDDANNELAWSVTRAGVAVVTRGALGIEISGTGVVGDEGTISNVATRTIDTTWTPPYGERAVIPDHFSEETLTLDHTGNGSLTVRLQVRAYDEGVALRYLVDGTGTLTVASEKTSFPLPATTQVWVSSTAQGVISKKAIGSVSGAVERPLTAELAPDLFAAFVYFDSRVATIGSHASQLAKTICIYSPWQYVFWYDRPPASPAPIGAGGAGDIIQDVPEMSFLPNTNPSAENLLLLRTINSGSLASGSSLENSDFERSASLEPEMVVNITILPARSVCQWKSSTFSCYISLIIRDLWR